MDVQLPGMLTAVVAHPPVFGAKLTSVDDSAAKRHRGRQGRAAHAHRPGWRRRGRGGEGYWAAKLGRDALKLEWDTSAV
jgi:isoquinoline 1-oxidoreductase beta subunit